MKQISLSRDSNHFRLYKKITKMEPPMSLCPYFWIWVSIIVFSPLILLYKGLLFIHSKVRKHNFEEKGTDYYPKKERRVRRWHNLGKIVERGFYICSGLFCLIVIGYGLYENIKQGITWSQVFEVLKGIGLFILILVISCVVCYFLVKTIKFTFNPNNRFMKFITKIGDYIGKGFLIAGEIIYAKYVKACPLIKWK